jgi:phosphoribosyl 1,2-cyclic phosphate phosphodiesterase
MLVFWPLGFQQRWSRVGHNKARRPSRSQSEPPQGAETSPLVQLFQTHTAMYPPTVFRACLGLLSLLLSMAPAAFAEPPAAPRETPAPYVVFLGTGAADIQRPKNDTCPNCTYVRQHNGRNARRYCSVFVSPGVLIDYSVTGREGLESAGIAPSAIDYLLITHSHGDHFNPAAIVALARERNKPLVLVGNAKTVARMQEHLETLPKDKRPAITFRTVKPFEEFDVGPWRGKALAANHIPNEEALLYVLRGKQKSLLYATDTGWFPVGTFAALSAESLDLAIVEGTFGEEVQPKQLTGHLNFPFVRLIRQFLVEGKRLKPGGRFMVTHLSLHFCKPYDLLAPKLAAEGIPVAYDGLRVGL